jgi:multicomponent Na+:H+ antiporter subunit E
MITLAILLFTFWIVLSGKFDAFHLGIGVVSAVCIALGTQPLLFRVPAIVRDGRHPLAAISWGRLLLYVPWLAWQVLLSSLQVLWVVIHPKMPISPCVVSFETPLPHELARLTLANSITLTPGTVTLDVDGDTFVVHALTTSSALSLEPNTGQGSMQRRIAFLYRASASNRQRGQSERT